MKQSTFYYLLRRGVIGGGGSAFTGLLDTYSGAAAAYSLRQLSSTYSGDAIVVRRASDNTTQSIGFVENELDTATLESFCSGTNGFVTTWYDQSGNSKDATQTNAARQPKIVDVGVVLTEGGKPTITFDGVDDNFEMSITGPISDPNISVIAALNMGGNNQSFLGANGFTGNGFLAYFGKYAYGANTLNTNIQANGTQSFLAFHINGSNSSFKAKNSLTGNIVTADLSGQTWSDINYIGARAQGLYHMDGDISELIIYATSQQSVSDDIELNLNTYYNIY